MESNSRNTINLNFKFYDKNTGVMLMIANAVQRGSSVYLYDETGQDLPVSIFTRGGRLVGFTASTVSIQNGTLIYTYDDRGNILGTPISTASQGTIQSDATNDRESSRYSNRGNGNTSDYGFIDGYIESLTNYVYRKGWSQKSIFGKLLTLILLPFAVCISAIQIAFTILRWLVIATVVLVVLYVFYIGIFS